MKSGWALCWGALAFVFLSAVAFRIVQADVDYSGANAADWFQAVGSILAIFAAIGVAWWEGGREQRRAYAELKAYRQTIAVLAESGARLVEAEVKQMLSCPAHYAYDSGKASEITQIAAVLEKFDVLRLESAHGVVALNTIIGLFEYSQVEEDSVADDFKQWGELSPDREEDIVGWGVAVREQADILIRISGDRDEIFRTMENSGG